MKISPFYIAMIGFGILLSATLSVPVFGQTNSAKDWAKWRGPQGSGVAVASDKVPTQWSDDRNVVWKQKIPGRGHSSPVIQGGRIFLTTADKSAQTQSVLCYDQSSGQPLWNKTVNTGGLPGRIHPNNTHASATIALSGKHLLAVFYHHNAIHATCYDVDGNEVWKKKVSDYVPDFPFGYGSSPIAYKNLFIVTSESKKDSAIVAYDVNSGNEVWRFKRGLPAGYKSAQNLVTSYSTPVVANVGGRDQMLISGINHIASVNPADGTELWKAPATWDVSCGTMVWDAGLGMVFASGGYPTQQTLAIKAEGSAEKVWENGFKCYEQSMIVVDGYLYGQTENGVIQCWDAETGEAQWQQKVRGPESASPIAVGKFIYFTNEAGLTVVIEANPDQFVKVAENRLGNDSFPSLAACNDQIFARVGQGKGESRQEWLYCLGGK